MTSHPTETDSTESPSERISASPPVIYTLENLPEVEVLPGFWGKFFHSEQMTFVHWRIEAGQVLPDHEHPHEQVSYVVAGQFELTIDGETRTLGPGEVAVIRSFQRHGGGGQNPMHDSGYLPTAPRGLSGVLITP